MLRKFGLQHRRGKLQVVCNDKQDNNENIDNIDNNLYRGHNPVHRDEI